MKREERFALFSFFENLIEIGRYIFSSLDCSILTVGSCFGSCISYNPFFFATFREKDLLTS
jgi:hypothetical protein